VSSNAKLGPASTALVPVKVVKGRRAPARRAANPRGKATPASGAIQIELAGARIFLHGAVSEMNLANGLRALARRSRSARCRQSCRDGGVF
jgi:hypothetical protein